MLALATALAALAGEAGHAESAAPFSRVGIGDEWARLAVQGAIRGAQRRLAQSKCQELLTDFQDASGRPLHVNLTALEQSSDGYLDLLLFRDGAETPQCKNHPHTLAYTAAGSRVVFVCGERFARRRLSDAAGSEFIVIHEALHSLGLGENPPSSSEITSQVRLRCR